MTVPDWLYLGLALIGLMYVFLATVGRRVHPHGWRAPYPARIVVEGRVVRQLPAAQAPAIEPPRQVYGPTSVHRAGQPRWTRST